MSPGLVLYQLVPTHSASLAENVKRGCYSLHISGGVSNVQFLARFCDNFARKRLWDKPLAFCQILDTLHFSVVVFL